MAGDNKNTEEKNISAGKQKEYEVTAQGSLGLLALGAVGIRAWRKKREEEKPNIKPNTGNE